MWATSRGEERSSNLVLGGSRGLVSTVISPLTGVVSNYKYSYFSYNDPIATKSHEPLSGIHHASPQALKRSFGPAQYRSRIEFP